MGAFTYYISEPLYDKIYFILTQLGIIDLIPFIKNNNISKYLNKK